MHTWFDAQLDQKNLGRYLVSMYPRPHIHTHHTISIRKIIQYFIHSFIMRRVCDDGYFFSQTCRSQTLTPTQSFQSFLSIASKMHYMQLTLTIKQKLLRYILWFSNALHKSILCRFLIWVFVASKLSRYAIVESATYLYSLYLLEPSCCKKRQKKTSNQEIGFWE